MQVDTRCSKCETKLRVDAALSGEEVRCPQCEFVFRVTPLDVEDVAADAPAGSTVEEVLAAGARNAPGTAPGPTWYLRIPEGRVYGPANETTLDNWVREGRVSAACELRPPEEQDWTFAGEKYPQLSEAGNPFRQARVTGVPKHLEPHRGMLIFWLSLAGCFVPLLSLWPAVLGTRDLKRMNAGKMDPAGDTLTRSGQAIAMVSSLVWVGAFGVTMLVLMIQLFSVR